VSCDFTSVINYLIPEAIAGQKCYMNMVRFPAVMEIRVFEMRLDLEVVCYLFI